MVSYLQVDNLSKRFGEQLLFEGISFGVGQGQKVALIARNVSGGLPFVCCHPGI